MIFSIFLASFVALAPDPTQCAVEDEPAATGTLVGTEIGWNGLAGIGVNLMRDVYEKRVTMDAGLGISATGYKLGMRLRYNIFTENLRPFLGLGVIVGTGFLEPLGNQDLTYKVRWSPFLQMVGGLAWVGKNRMAVIGTLGWAQLLRSANVLILDGTPSNARTSFLRKFVGSGPVASVMLGYQL